MSRPLYHTALGGEPPLFEPRYFWRSDGHPTMEARVCDLSRDQFPQSFTFPDVLYCEPAWPKGYAKFEARSGLKTGGYKAYMQGLARQIEYGVPAVIVHGKSMQRHLPEAPLVIEDILLEGGKVLASFYGGAEHSRATDKGTTLEILDVLATEYNAVLDPSCGFGHAPRAFARAGRGFVVADISPSCIGYVVQSVPAWVARTL